MAVLDTTFLIDLEHGRPAALKRVRELEADGTPLRVPPATWIEYLYRQDPGRRASSVRDLEASVVFEPLTREIADEAVLLQAQLAAEGNALAWHDLEVAAAARYLREPLITNDRAFAKVPGLQILKH